MTPSMLEQYWSKNKMTGNYKYYYIQNFLAKKGLLQ